MAEKEGRYPGQFKEDIKLVVKVALGKIKYGDELYGNGIHSRQYVLFYIIAAQLLAQGHPSRISKYTR